MLTEALLQAGTDAKKWVPNLQTMRWVQYKTDRLTPAQLNQPHLIRSADVHRFVDMKFAKSLENLSETTDVLAAEGKVCGRRVPVFGPTGKACDSIPIMDAVGNHKKNGMRGSSGNILGWDVGFYPSAHRVAVPRVVTQAWLERLVPPPKEQDMSRFIIMSAPGSFTDMHIDAGAAGTWFAVAGGEKVFLTYPPSSSFLDLVTQKEIAKNKLDLSLYLRDQPGYIIDIGPGDAAFIPPGWLHAVVTIAKTMAASGAFLLAVTAPLHLWSRRLADDPRTKRHPTEDYVAAADIVQQASTASKATKEERRLCNLALM